MLNISRREKYGNMGHSINKSGKFIDLTFDLHALDLMCRYIMSENCSVRRSHWINMRNLFNMLNPELYINDAQKAKRIHFINKGLEGRLNQNIKNSYLLLKYINGGMMDDDLIPVEELSDQLSSEELAWINETVSESLKYGFIYNDMDRMINICTRFKSADYRSKAEIVKEFEGLIDEFKTNFRRAKVDSLTDITFSLSPGQYEETVKELHSQLINPSSRLFCGMQGMNSLFGGGVENGRCYMVLGPSGTFKSGTLLSLVYQIKKNNKFIQLKDPTKRPAIVLLTMENTVKESLERLFNMSTVSDDIRGFSEEEVLTLLKTQGELYISDESPIDIIIKYKPNGSVDTGYLYTLVEELEDEGIETICLVQDYVRRIRSAYKQPDVRLELGEIVNEFKVFCAIKDIPLITAGQLNREAARTIETAKQAKKSDVVRQLGRSNIGESMLMIDNLDWACVINIEYDSAGNKYLAVQRIKNRFKVLGPDVLFLPFVSNNDMKLVEDMHLDVPLYRETLREGVEEQTMYNNGMNTVMPNRKNIEDIIAERKNLLEDDNVFDMATYRMEREQLSINNTIQNQNKTEATVPFKFIS